LRRYNKAVQVDKLECSRGVESAMAGAMLAVCVFHSSVCASVIDFFNCDPPTGEHGYEVAPGGVHMHMRFLVKDYSISCNSAKYRAYRPYASIMLLIYAVVFPAGSTSQLNLSRFHH